MKTNVRTHYRRTRKKIALVRRHKRSYSGRRFASVKVPPNLKKVEFFEDQPYLAKGEDSKGRMQYIYSKSFLNKKKEQKYKRVRNLDEKMAGIIRKVTEDADKGIEEAQVVYALYHTGLRPGSETDTMAEQKAYGLTTLKRHHIKMKGNDMFLDFIGKKGVHIVKEIKDKRLKGILSSKKSSDNLFHTTREEVLDYFKRKAGNKFLLKDLRTLKAGTIASKFKDSQKAAVKVSEELHNTPAVAKSAYIDPKITEGQTP